MIGQEKLLTQVDSLSVEGFPHSILVVGEPGSGKHTLCKHVANLLDVEMCDITDATSFENMVDVWNSTVPRLYVVEIDSRSVKKQNEILKFVEEPSDMIYVAILATNEQDILDTLKNRCIEFKLDSYTEEELYRINSNIDPKLLKFCSVPGDVVGVDYADADAVLKLADNVVSSVGKAKYSNLFNISDSIKTTKTGSGINIHIFLKVLKSKFYDSYLLGDEPAFNRYLATVQALKDVETGVFNNTMVLDNFIFKLKDICL